MQHCPHPQNNLKHSWLHKMYSPPPPWRKKQILVLSLTSLLSQTSSAETTCSVCLMLHNHVLIFPEYCSRQRKTETEAGRSVLATTGRRWVIHLWLWHKKSNLQIRELFMQVVYAPATILSASSGLAEFISLNAVYAKQLCCFRAWWYSIVLPSQYLN